MSKHSHSTVLPRHFIAGAFFLSLIAFTSHMTVITFLKSRGSIADLRFASGKVTGRDMQKYTTSGKYNTKVQELLVLSIEGSSERFGFLQSSHAFQELFGFHTVGKTIEIYYDPTGRRIQDNITLHILDMKVGQAKIIDIAESNSDNRNMAIFFFALTILFATLGIVIIKQDIERIKANRNRKRAKKSFNL